MDATLHFFEPFCWPQDTATDGLAAGTNNMATSIFRQFISALSKDWKTRFSSIQRVRVTYSPMMPKASTFQVGNANRFGKALFTSAVQDVSRDVASFFDMIAQQGRCDNQ
jgi:hypothetical protein